MELSKKNIENQRLYELKKDEEGRKKSPGLYMDESDLKTRDINAFVQAVKIIEEKFQDNDLKALLNIGRTLLKHGAQFVPQFKSGQKAIAQQVGQIDKIQEGIKI